MSEGHDNLRVLTAEPLGEGIFEALNEVRALAERGELSSIAIVMVTRNGNTGQRWSTAPSLPLLMASAQTLVYRLSKRIVGDPD